MCKGLVKIVRSLSSVPLDTMKCLSNCAQDVLDSLGSEKLQEIAAKIPDLSKYFLDDSEGQLREEGIMDNYDNPRFETGDSRIADKDNRTQCQQRVVVLNSKGARKRRRDWIEKKNSQNSQQQSEGSGNDTGDPCGVDFRGFGLSDRTFGGGSPTC
jgi:hypothetical protein